MLQPSKAQKEYWEKQLKRYGLAEDKEPDQFLVFGELDKLDFDGRTVYHVDADAIGERLDQGDWPISLC